MLCLALGAMVSTSGLTAREEKKSAPLTVKEVLAAQQAWCDGLVKIGKLYAEKGDYKAFTEKFIDDTYDYSEGKTFFRPTLATRPAAFRKTKEGALAYFIGGNPKFPDDGGFALKKWVKVEVEENEGLNSVQIHGNIAITMGNIHLTNAAGDKVTVDKTFVFRRCDDGKLRLIVHKSALPNTPAEK
jgi:hypothetical protein